MSVTLPITVRMTVSPNKMEYKLTNSMTINATIIEIPNYNGPYEVTPSDETQNLETQGLRATGDIVINPIPSNYGRIGWNGSYLTVS